MGWMGQRIRRVVQLPLQVIAPLAARLPWRFMLVFFRGLNKDLSMAQYFPCQLKAHRKCFSKFRVIHF